MKLFSLWGCKDPLNVCCNKILNIGLSDQHNIGSEFLILFCLVVMNSKLHPRMNWVQAQPVNRSPSVRSQVSGEET